jgi:hypothetical protein
VTAVFIILGLVAACLLAWGLWPCEHDTTSLEFQRIEMLKQAAMDDIRRRREHAEDQLRRLDRWL